jgi:transcriptional regulator CtsR
MIYPLTKREQDRYQRITRKMKSKQEKINVLLSSGRDSIIERKPKMNIYELNDTNIMSEEEMRELFAWLNGEMLKGGE